MVAFSKRTLSTFLSDERGGAELVEASVAVPLFVLLLIGTFGWTFYMLQLSILEFASQQASRCAIIPLVNGKTNPYCGFAPNSTFQTYGTLNTLGLSKNDSDFFLGSYSNGLNYKLTCIDSNVANPLSFLSQTLLPNVTYGSACRPVQQQ